MGDMLVSGNAMEGVIRQGDVAQIETWVRDGLDLATWRDNYSYNIYHYCVSFNASYGALCVAEAVPRLCQTHATLLSKANHYMQSPLLQACSFSVFDDAYILAVLEILIRHSKDIEYERLLFKSRNNPRMHNFLAWRRKNPTGLPKELAKSPNQNILRFIETIEKMDNSTATQYLKSIQEEAEETRNIRIVILGYQGVGKTTLFLRLTGQDISLLKSTDQVDIHQNIVIVDRETEKCWLLPQEWEHDVARSRLRDVLIDSMSSQRAKEGHMKKKVEEQSKMKPTSEKPLLQHDPSLKSEAGVAMSATTINRLGSANSKAYVSIFDFGGEIMFSNFQHIFLNTNNVILLCFSLHNVFEEDKILDRIYFWLKFLSTFADEDKMFCPPVVLVGTYLDKVPMSERGDIKERVKAQLLKETKCADAFHRHVIAFEVVAEGEDELNVRLRKLSDAPFDSSIETQHQHDVIWKQIFIAAEYQSQWNQLLPAKWLLLERELMILKSQGKKVMTLEEIKDRARKLPIPLEDADVIAMLRYLHGTRSILCFQLDHPDGKVVLDIKFVIDAFRLIVTDIKFHTEKTNIDPSLQQEYGKPRLTMDFICAVWKPVSEFHHFMETLLFYLERLELIVKPLPNEGEKTVDYFIVPYLLDEADPSHIREMLLDMGTVKSATLCFDFMGRFIPPAVYNKILASCIHRFALFAREDSEPEIYLQQGLACFVLSPRWKMILHCKDSRMKVTLFSNTITEIKAGDGYSIRCIMEAILKSTLERNKQGHMKFQYFISTDFEVTRNEETVPVELPTESSSPVDAEAAVWCPKQTQMNDLAFFSADETNNCLTTKQMSHVAKFIGLDYALLFVELGMQTSEIDQTYWSFRDCLRTVVTYLLVKWSNKLGEKAEIRLLFKAMKSQGFNTDDIMEHLREMAKAGKHRPTSAEDDRCPTARERLLIAKKINLSYVIFFLELDLDIEAIDRARMDHRRSIDRFSELMEQWVKNSGQNATLTNAYVAAKECSMNWTKLRMEIQKKKNGNASGSSEVAMTVRKGYFF